MILRKCPFIWYCIAAWPPTTNSWLIAMKAYATTLPDEIVPAHWLWTYSSRISSVKAACLSNIRVHTEQTKQWPYFLPDIRLSYSNLRYCHPARIVRMLFTHRVQDLVQLYSWNILYSSLFPIIACGNEWFHWFAHLHLILFDIKITLAGGLLFSIKCILGCGTFDILILKLGWSICFDHKFVIDRREESCDYLAVCSRLCIQIRTYVIGTYGI